jgi:hypothetical protein
VKKRTQGGQLRIGDQWNAIKIIARSQTHPLKAVCELTENAIDARARQVQILRRRNQGQVYLEVADDGEGIRLNDQGEPDFAAIGTHICDSMKRHLGDSERSGIHGEFGIGLLSFWSLGEELRLVSASPSGKLFEMQLKRGKKNYRVHSVRGQLPMGGTRVIVGPLLDSTRNIVTGEKLVRYLSAELRNRIRSTGVKVRILDRVSRKDLVVTPREFQGDRIDVAQKVTTPHGELLVELYFREAVNGSDGGVAVCKDGTRVLKDITELDHFQRAPWNEGRVEGVLDFAALNLAPGTRHGIVPDERLVEFIRAVETLEPSLHEAIAQREQAESDRASRQILRQLHKAFVTALRELPSNEYLFFDIPTLNRSLSAAAGTEAKEQGEEAGLSVVQREVIPEEHSEAVGEPPLGLLPLEPGRLATVRITPRHARRKPGEECTLTATAKDEHDMRISEQVQYAWRIAAGDGRLVSIEGQTCRITSHLVGEVLVEVHAMQGENLATDQVTVKFLENVPDHEQDKAKGLPAYRLEPEHGKPWRSRYDAKQNEIIINSAHRDFLSSKTTVAKHRRYIGKLYAKEVVLINFPHESPDEVMERLIEITLRTEDLL